MTASQHAESRHLLQVYGQLPLEATSAQGVYLHAGKRRIIDFYGGHAVAALGYAHPDLLAALNTQAKSMYFQSNAVALEVRAKAGDALATFAPTGLKRVFFVPFALYDRDAYTTQARKRFGSMGCELDSIHDAPDAPKAIADAEGIFIGGGNTFRLLNALYQFDVLFQIRRRVEEGRRWWR